MLIDKELMGWISIVLTIISIAPYCYFILTGKVKPHAFSWFIWSVFTAIGFAAQYTEGAGAGAWSTAAAAIACFGVTLLAIFKGERNIATSDKVSLAAALSAIPLWYATSDPLWSVVLISIMDVIGYWPTIRKSYHKPHEELIFTHFMGIVKYVFAFLALENLTLSTWLYPAAISAANLLLIIILVIRRAAVDNRKNKM